MAEDGLRKTNLKGLRLKGSALAGEGSGVIQLPNITTGLPTTAGNYYLGVSSGSLVFVANGSSSTVGAAGGGVATFDSLYQLDQALTINGSSLTFDGTHATNDVLTITNASGTGDALQITNSGTGKDVNGTSSTWSVSKAGALLIKSIAHPTAATDLTVDAGTSGVVKLATISTGGILLGDDTTLDTSKTLTMTGAGGSTIVTLTAGDVVLSDSSLAITDADDASSFSLTNNTLTTASLMAITSTSLSTGKGLLMTANGLTTGHMVSLVTTSAGMTSGSYINVNDGSERFAVKADGATLIETGVNSTVGLTVSGIQTSANLVDLSTSGVTATGVAVLKVATSGATAAGGSVLLVSASGTPASSTSYLAHFDYSGATVATNDPIAVQIKNADSVGAALNIISTATTITGGILNITANSMTTGKGINFAHTTGVIAGGGTLANLSSTSIDTTTTSGALLTLTSTASTSGTQLLATYSALTDGIGHSLVMDALTTGTALSITNAAGIMTTTGSLLTLTANAATTAAGLLRINANGLTSGIGAVITSSATAITGAGRMLRVDHTGISGGTAILSEFASAAADETVILKVTASAALALGTALAVSGASITTGNAITANNLNALTDGYGLHLASSATAMTATGRLLLSNHTGITTTSGILNEFKSAANDETELLKLTVTDVLAAGKILNISGAAMTTGKALTIGDLNALTDGYGIHVASSSVLVSSTGRMLFSNHTGAAAVSAILNEFKSAAADETVVAQVTATAALAAGAALKISGAAVTTGTLVDISDNTAHTTGTALKVYTNSADTGTRSLVDIKQDHASASGATPLTIANDNATKPLIAGTAAATATNYFKIMTANGVTLWMGNGTTGNALLTATTGDILFNGGSNKPEYCTNGAGSLWTALV